MKVAVAHDYLTQRGGAERVALTIALAFPGAPVYTSVYDRSRTYPDFADLDVRTLGIDHVPGLRRWTRLAMPVLAPSFSGVLIDADVVVCSSSGWAHGVKTTGRKIVYCHNAARWLYQTDQYLASAGGRSSLARMAVGVLEGPLTAWDQRAAASADRYLVNSCEVQRRVHRIYGIDADVLNPPHSMRRTDPVHPVPNVPSSFVLCVSRLLPYKNVGAVVAAFEQLPDHQLVVVGSGPEERALRAAAGPNVHLVGQVSDAQLRFLYGSATALVAASYEDFGLTPLEANTFGVPVVALRWGGFLETVREGETGLFFDSPAPAAIADGIRRAHRTQWDCSVLSAHGDAYGVESFSDTLRAIVAEEVAGHPR